MVVEWAYSKDRKVPAELVSSNPEAIDACVRRDTDSAARHSNTYRTGWANALNELGVYPVKRVIANPGPGYFVAKRSDKYVTVSGGRHYEIYETFAKKTEVLKRRTR